MISVSIDQNNSDYNFWHNQAALVLVQKHRHTGWKTSHLRQRDVKETQKGLKTCAFFHQPQEENGQLELITLFLCSDTIRLHRLEPSPSPHKQPGWRIPHSIPSLNLREATFLWVAFPTLLFSLMHSVWITIQYTMHPMKCTSSFSQPILWKSFQ